MELTHESPEVVERVPKKFIVKRKYDLQANDPRKDFPELYKVESTHHAKSSAYANKKKI